MSAMMPRPAAGTKGERYSVRLTGEFFLDQPLNRAQNQLPGRAAAANGDLVKLLMERGRDVERGADGSPASWLISSVGDLPKSHLP
jgi:hypothetical protein